MGVLLAITPATVDGWRWLTSGREEPLQSCFRSLQLRRASVGLRMRTVDMMHMSGTRCPWYLSIWMWVGQSEEHPVCNPHTRARLSLVVRQACRRGVDLDKRIRVSRRQVERLSSLRSQA